MEVYEVMFFALPLWMGMVAFIFSLVFGMDIIEYFSSKHVPKNAEAPRPLRAVATCEECIPDYSPYEDTRNRERKLVNH